MDGRRKPEAEQRPNSLSVRWSDYERRALVDEAWRQRVAAAELVRRYTAEGLKRNAAEAMQ